MTKAHENGEPANRRRTKLRILDAAERLFAERGYHAASLRAITAEARVNLAAANYHFGSKDSLLQAVFARRMRPLNEERLALLDRCEAQAAGGPLPPEKLLRILVEPVLRLGSGPSEGLVSFRKLLGRMYSEPDKTQHLFGREMESVIRRFTAALLKSYPGLPRRELAWRIHFIIGAMAHTLVAGNMLLLVSGGLCDPADTESALEQLVAFARAGLGAPVTPGGQRRKPAKGQTPPEASGSGRSGGSHDDSPTAMQD
ncbi:MAG: TetR/AcrR family transcriptional regulator [Acidobacteria bacterium]|nr:TetR/AcrR family transcriptional regulator [Acidobacteriota bacterium]